VLVAFLVGPIPSYLKSSIQRETCDDVTLWQMKHNRISFMFSQQIICPWWRRAILATSFFKTPKEKGYHRCWNKILQWTQVILTNKTSTEKILSCVAKNGNFWLKK
jgi:hypothetical protein